MVTGRVMRCPRSDAVRCGEYHGLEGPLSSCLLCNSVPVFIVSVTGDDNIW